MPETVNVESLTRWIRLFHRDLRKDEEHLTTLDRDTGDGDHGINMVRGFGALVGGPDIDGCADVATLLQGVVMTRVMAGVGGASGLLYGVFFRAMATVAGAGAASLDCLTFARALRAGLTGVELRGRAKVGDKTMVDALSPAFGVLDVALVNRVGLGVALRCAAAAAAAGREATIGMRARRGRANFVPEGGVGYVDPGAASAALLIAAAAAAFADIQC